MRYDGDHSLRLRLCSCNLLYLVALGACPLALGACQNDERFAAVEKPEAPDMQPVLDAFAAPTASVDLEASVELTELIAAHTDAIDGLQVDQLLVDAITEGIAQLQQQGRDATQTLDNAVDVAQQPIAVEGDGYLVITRICDGWGATPVPDPANGTLELTAGFTEDGLDPVVWGSVFACKYRLDERSIQIDGLDADPAAIDVRAYIGEAVTFEHFGAVDEPIVVDIAARVTTDGVQQSGQFSFKVVRATRSFETLVPVGDGHVVAGVSLDHTSSVQVRASNGTFVCDVEAKSCMKLDESASAAP